MRYLKNLPCFLKCIHPEENNKRIIRNNKIEIAVNFIRLGKNSYDEIAEATGLTVEEVEKLAETLNHSA